MLHSSIKPESGFRELNAAEIETVGGGFFLALPLGAAFVPISAGITVTGSSGGGQGVDFSSVGDGTFGLAGGNPFFALSTLDPAALAQLADLFPPPEPGPDPDPSPVDTAPPDDGSPSSPPPLLPPGVSTAGSTTTVGIVTIGGVDFSIDIFGNVLNPNGAAIRLGFEIP